MAGNPEDRQILYEPDEVPPPGLSAGLGLQYALLSLSSIIMIPLIVFRAAQAPEETLVWAVFASIVICGLITAVQALRIGRIGAGYVVITGTTGTAIAVSADALAAGGIGLLAALVAVASLVQFLIAMKLSLFRRVFTPTVAGVVLMLIPVTVMPVVLGMLDDVPSGTAPAAAPLTVLATVAVLCGIMVKGTPKLRAWGPLIALVIGAATAAAFGTYGFDRVAAADWFGIPGEWPAFAFDFGPSFLQLLPAFVLVFLVLTVRTISGVFAIQGVSWRLRRAVDFRAAQGAVAAEAASNLLSGLAGTVPNGARATTVPLTELTGVAARRVGLFLGLFLAGLAFFPKVPALVLALPGPVIAAYIAVMIALIFALGMRMIVADGLDRRQTLVVGVSFSIGAGCQYGLIYPEVVPHIAGGLLNSGLSAGGLTAILLTGLMELTTSPARKLQTDLDLTALPAIREFVGGFAAQNGWNEAMANRLDSASEETLLTLLRDDKASESRRRLLVKAHRQGPDAVLEFIAAGGEENIEDRLALLGQGAAESSLERDVSLRLLGHLAAEVRHRQYFDTDFIMIRVAPEP